MEYLIYAGMFLASLAGMFVHFLKKNVKGETSTEIVNYFRDNFKSTALAVFFTAIGFLTAITADAISYERVIPSILTAALIGYTFDSMANKWDKGELQGKKKNGD